MQGTLAVCLRDGIDPPRAVSLAETGVDSEKTLVAENKPGAYRAEPRVCMTVGCFVRHKYPASLNIRDWFASRRKSAVDFLSNKVDKLPLLVVMEGVSPRKGLA
jgi:hypothetical protein